MSLLPRLTQARAPLVREVSVINELGQANTVSIPAERALTVYVVPDREAPSP
jgi:FdhD protein